MPLFIFIFLLIYSVMHAVVYVQARILLPEHKIIRAGALVFIVLMIILPILARILDRKGFENISVATGVIGYEWMGFIFIAFWGSLLLFLLEFIRLIVSIHFLYNIPSLIGKKPVCVMLIAVILLLIYGSIEAGNIRIERLQIQTRKLPPEKSRITIVQISDLHLGLFTRSSQLKGIIDKVKRLSPDILVSTGDMVDSSGDHLDGLSGLFHDIQPPYGKYAVTGNHELYAGVQKSVEFLTASGFTLLRDQSITVDSFINIAGADDIHVNPSSNMKRILDPVQNGLFTLMLMHRPSPDESALGMFDLQLSGHTHSGQIFPFHFFVSIPFPYFSGMYDLDRGSRLYVNRGTGSWGPQVRLFAPPEITVIELIRE